MVNAIVDIFLFRLRVHRKISRWPDEKLHVSLRWTCVNYI